MKTKAQEWLVNEETLTDGSKVFNVVGFDGSSRITIGCVNMTDAIFVSRVLNEDAMGFQIETFGKAAQE